MSETGGLTTAYETLRLYGPYVLLTVAVMLLLQALFGSPLRTGKVEENKGDTDENEERDPPRNFSPAQLRRYTGVKLEGSMDPNAGKIFVSINRNVYDVTSAPQFYGPGANYECFAGRDASRALAKLSFAEEDLNNLNTSDLSAAERDELSNWETRFHMKGYPIVGKLVVPETPAAECMTLEELATHNGKESIEGTGRVDPPLFVGVKDKVYDVSFGGYEMYKEGATYHLFVGIDASKALAKMKFDEEFLRSRDLSDLNERELEVLDDWADRFENKKLYPVVGYLPPRANNGDS